MRIDSMSYYSTILGGLGDNQGAIARLNQQLAADQKLLSAKDDPLATEKILDLSNRVAVRTQYAANQDKAELALKYEETVLTEMSKTLSDARSLISGLGPSTDPALRDTHAYRLKSYAQQLLGLVNMRDASGHYIFGGYNTTTKPFDNPLDGTATATTYAGTPNPGGTRAIEVDVGRPIQVNDNLDAVVQSGVAGSDLFQELDDAAANLAGPTLTQTDITDWMARLETAVDAVEAIRHRIAAARSEVLDARATNQALKVQEEDALSGLMLLDKASAIVELQSRQTTLQAAEQAYARTANLSLFNYIG